MTLSRLLLLGTLTATVIGCAPFKPDTSIPVSLVKSPNFDQRRPNLVILHHTTNDTAERALQTLTTPVRAVSSHFLIARDGRIIQLVEENARAWHAGKSWWGGQTDINSASIGIELDNNGNEPFAEPQISSLLALLDDLRTRHKIPAANFIGHADVAPTRKNDPSIFFPWQRLAQYGFGLWCDRPFPPAPTDFDLQLALQALGYDPSTPEASRSAFRLHYVRSESPLTDEEEKSLAYCLLQQKAIPTQPVLPLDSIPAAVR
ncbi:N-acetyl-anhydromuramyl-L-alanine amidase AmpD [Paucimonas lemoignei]|uniref:N-acetylmuramoyl-L-alanine amidase n=1 Tax=Paucimonas lemoignei TaxID=29443 RepID=A0A4R3HP95_PAULE|nr:N-acetylmuramoyl-L-alanine amidase [Paucimonas lemoignei]TCS33250.1 N-acetyl-anhydromuramyl-L-alanine amidase AmpD [Paucimonas lemoignei]